MPDWFLRIVMCWSAGVGERYWGCVFVGTYFGANYELDLFNKKFQRCEGRTEVPEGWGLLKNKGRVKGSRDGAPLGRSVGGI